MEHASIYKKINRFAQLTFDMTQLDIEHTRSRLSTTELLRPLFMTPYNNIVNDVILQRLRLLTQKAITFQGNKISVILVTICQIFLVLNVVGS